jgi:ankyrin repeat protein
MAKRIIVICIAVFLSCVAGISLGAGPSEVASAAERGDLAAVRDLIRNKADVNATQPDGSTALHWAVYRNDVAMIDSLLLAGAKVKVTNRNGISPLFMASLYGNPPVINSLLKRGADAKEKGPNGETMLMLAARNGNPEAIRLLIAAGADVNAKETLRGTTALMWAVEQKHPAAVKALLAGGALRRVQAMQGIRETTWRRRARTAMPGSRLPRCVSAWPRMVARRWKSKSGREARRSATRRAHALNTDGMQPVEAPPLGIVPAAEAAQRVVEVAANRGEVRRPRPKPMPRMTTRKTTDL